MNTLPVHANALMLMPAPRPEDRTVQVAPLSEVNKVPSCPTTTQISGLQAAAYNPFETLDTRGTQVFPLSLDVTMVPPSPTTTSGFPARKATALRLEMVEEGSVHEVPVSEMRMVPPA